MKAKLLLKVIFMSAALLGIIGLMKNLKSPNTLNSPNSTAGLLLGVGPQPIAAKVIIGAGATEATSGSKNVKDNH